MPPPLPPCKIGLKIMQLPREDTGVYTLECRLPSRSGNIRLEGKFKKSHTKLIYIIYIYEQQTGKQVN